MQGRKCYVLKGSGSEESTEEETSEETSSGEESSSTDAGEVLANLKQKFSKKQQQSTIVLVN